MMTLFWGHTYFNCQSSLLSTRTLEEQEFCVYVLSSLLSSCGVVRIQQISSWMKATSLWTRRHHPLLTDEWPWWGCPIGFQLRGAVTLQVQSEAKSPLKKFLLNLAIASKFNEVKRGVIRRDSFWDKLIFAKIQVCWVEYGWCQVRIWAAHWLSILCFSFEGQASL